MITLSYLKYRNFLALLLAGMLFFLKMPTTTAQQKTVFKPKPDTFRIRIVKENNGELKLLDTTFTTSELEKFKAQPGEVQDMLKELEDFKIYSEEKRTPGHHIITRALPHPENMRLVNPDSLRIKLSADSNVHINFLRKTLIPVSVSPDSAHKIILKLRENGNQHPVLIYDSNIELPTQSSINREGQNIIINRIAPITQIYIDTIRLSKDKNSQTITTKSGNKLVVRKVVIQDVELRDTPVLNKVNPKEHTYLTEDLKINNLRYYPNPNNGRFTLSFKVTKPNDLAIRIYDQLGREIYQENYQYYSGDYQKEINMPQVEPGIYFLKLIQGDSSLTKKLVID